MTEAKEIAREITALIAARIQAGQETQAPWITKEYLSSKGEIEGDDVDFYKTCAHAYVWEIAKKCVARYDQQSVDENREQLVLEGFTELRKAYSVTRNGQQAIVPIEKCTAEELLARAHEYERQAETLKKHAREIRDYVEQVFGIAA
jgi:hypothetical protein